MNSVGASAAWIGRLVARPARRAECLVLELLQLRLVGAVLALQFQVLANCLVENAHCDPGKLKTMGLSLALRGPWDDPPTLPAGL